MDFKIGDRLYCHTTLVGLNSNSLTEGYWYKITSVSNEIALSREGKTRVIYVRGDDLFRIGFEVDAGSELWWRWFLTEKQYNRKKNLKELLG